MILERAGVCVCVCFCGLSVFADKELQTICSLSSSSSLYRRSKNHTIWPQRAEGGEQTSGLTAREAERRKSAWQAFNAEVHIIRDYCRAPPGDRRGLSRTPARLALQNKRSLAGFTRLSINFPATRQGKHLRPFPLFLYQITFFPSLGWDSCCPFTWTDDITHAGEKGWNAH